MVEHREYFYRRLHSLLGVVPIGIFVVQHLIVNHFVVYGEESFNKAAGFMGSLPFVLALEIIVIYLPILFHAILGVYIVFTARNNPKNYGFFRNWMFLLQRITGIITLIFIAWHVWQTRVQVALGNAEVNYELMEGILTQPFYVLVLYHFHSCCRIPFSKWIMGLLCFMGNYTISTFTTNHLHMQQLIVFVVVSYIGIRTIIAIWYWSIENELEEE